MIIGYSGIKKEKTIPAKGKAGTEIMIGRDSKAHSRKFILFKI